MKTVYENKEDGMLFVEKQKSAYYCYTNKYDEEFDTEKELNEFLKKYNFEYVGME